MKHLEIEFKTLLSPENYQALLPRFEGSLLHQQTNYYFDNPQEEMKKKKIALRIRRFEDRAELTLKVPQKSHLAHMEFNQDLSIEEADAILEGKESLSGFIAQQVLDRGVDLFSLAPLGALHTKRYEFEDPNGIWALDQSSYLDQVDYELEFEVLNEDKGRRVFIDFLDSYQIAYQQAPSKLARFAQRLEQVNKEKD